MDRYMRSERYEREARRLRAEYAHDLTVRAIVTADLAIRRAAQRIAGWVVRAAGISVADSHQRRFS